VRGLGSPTAFTRGVATSLCPSSSLLGTRWTASDPLGSGHPLQICPGPWVPTRGAAQASDQRRADSECWGYLQDKYTTLQPTRDRLMATSLLAQWWHTSEDVDSGKSYDGLQELTVRRDDAPDPGLAFDLGQDW
jgi:hypothetical protein